MKRMLILAPRLRDETSSAAHVFGQVLSSLAPPPEVSPPPLWMKGGLQPLHALSWPPQRQSRADA
jgi:hypothetical protein